MAWCIRRVCLAAARKWQSNELILGQRYQQPKRNIVGLCCNRTRHMVTMTDELSDKRSTENENIGGLSTCEQNRARYENNDVGGENSDLDVHTNSENLNNSGELSKPAVNNYLDLYQGIGEHHTKPAIQSKSFNLAAYVNESETLSNLVKLGVNLSRVEKRRADARNLLLLDFDKEVKPYLTFLHNLGVPTDQLGGFVTKNPGIFREDLDNLHTRVKYLESKKFGMDAICRIITVAPQVLSLTTKELDTQLGYFQKEFKLKGDEVRFVLTRYPKLAITVWEAIKDRRFNLKEYLGFTEREMKQLLMEFPKVYLQDKRLISDRFDYLHNEMKISHEIILRWPRILSTRIHIIRQRHLFLKHLGRDQFNPNEPNFVSLHSLVTVDDAKFCEDLAKVPVKDYNNFLKTI